MSGRSGYRTPYLLLPAPQGCPLIPELLFCLLSTAWKRRLLIHLTPDDHTIDAEAMAEIMLLIPGH